jgi:hypothetical protein
MKIYAPLQKNRGHDSKVDPRVDPSTTKFEEHISSWCSRGECVYDRGNHQASELKQSRIVSANLTRDYMGLNKPQEHGSLVLATNYKVLVSLHPRLIHHYSYMQNSK